VLTILTCTCAGEHDMVEDHFDNAAMPSEEASQLSRQLDNISTAPGVYLFKDRQGKILYVGKARNLKKRVRSYFQAARPHDPKTRVLLTKVVALETIITHTEQEALILESNLIKRHRPRYNVVLKDDKRYPSLRLDLSQPFPNLNIVRKIKKDSASYFGPYASSAAVRQTLKFIYKTFKLRKCRNQTFNHRTRPCLNYQMGLCLGPCSMDVDPKVYQVVVDEVVDFLRGRTPSLIGKIKTLMKAAADNQEFERAAALRDKMYALEKTVEKQVSVTSDFKDRDVVALVIEENATAAVLLRVRGGFLLGSRQFDFESAIGSADQQMSAFLRQFYWEHPEIPPQILVNCMPDDLQIIETSLSELRGAKVSIAMPQRGEKFSLLQLAVQNAHKALHEQAIRQSANLDLLIRLQKRLGMENLPQRIECFDNSNLAGTHPVAAMVVFENGEPFSGGYRRYKLEFSGKPDDYAYMYEVLHRRLGKREDSSPLPNLLLVDGGKGQLSVALGVLEALGLNDKFAVAGIAKKNEALGETTDKIYLPGRVNPVQFSRDPDLLLFLQRIRDEAHRAAIGFQRSHRGKQSLKSFLDDLVGIGPKRKASLLKHFGSIEKIGAATIKELALVPGISDTVAQSIHAALSGK
jgi:excinuclease ABC subunit C